MKLVRTEKGFQRESNFFYASAEWTNFSETEQRRNQFWTQCRLRHNGLSAVLSKFVNSAEVWKKYSSPYFYNYKITN